jgi:hypothetical protein
VALIDGALTDPELAYLRKAGGELGLRVAAVDRLVDDESRRASPPSRPPPPSSNGSHPSGTVGGIRAVLSAPTALMRTTKDRRTRSAVKAGAPVLVGCALAGALAPVVAGAGIAVIGLPALASIGEVGAARSWSAWARTPLRFAMHVHRALGHAARVFVPLALLGLAVSSTTGIRSDWLARGGGALAMVALVWLAINRLPFSADRSAPGLRAGRDIVWRGLVGDSGRARRSSYVLWAACVGAGIALGADNALWWPLPIR